MPRVCWMLLARGTLRPAGVMLPPPRTLGGVASHAPFTAVGVDRLAEAHTSGCRRVGIVHARDGKVHDL